MSGETKHNHGINPATGEDVKLANCVHCAAPAPPASGPQPFTRVEHVTTSAGDGFMLVAFDDTAVMWREGSAQLDKLAATLNDLAESYARSRVEAERACCAQIVESASLEWHEGDPRKVIAKAIRERALRGGETVKP